MDSLKDLKLPLLRTVRVDAAGNAQREVANSNDSHGTTASPRTISRKQRGSVRSRDPQARSRYAGETKCMILFCLTAIGYTSGFTALSAAMVFYKQLYSARILFEFNTCYFLPSIPMLVLQVVYDHQMDQRFGVGAAHLFRNVVALGGSTLVLASFPFWPECRATLLGCGALMGMLSGISFGSSHQLVPFFSARCSVALEIGFVASAPLILATTWFFGVTYHASWSGLFALYEVAASLSLLGLLSVLLLIRSEEFHYHVTSKSYRKEPVDAVAAFGAVEGRRHSSITCRLAYHPHSPRAGGAGSHTCGSPCGSPRGERPPKASTPKKYRPSSPGRSSTSPGRSPLSPHTYRGAGAAPLSPPLSSLSCKERMAFGPGLGDSFRDMEQVTLRSPRRQNRRPSRGAHGPRTPSMLPVSTSPSVGGGYLGEYPHAQGDDGGTTWQSALAPGRAAVTGQDTGYSADEGWHDGNGQGRPHQVTGEEPWVSGHQVPDGAGGRVIYGDGRGYPVGDDGVEGRDVAVGQRGSGAAGRHAGKGSRGGPGGGSEDVQGTDRARGGDARGEEYGHKGQAGEEGRGVEGYSEGASSSSGESQSVDESSSGLSTDCSGCESGTGSFTRSRLFGTMGGYGRLEGYRREGDVDSKAECLTPIDEYAPSVMGGPGAGWRKGRGRRTRGGGNGRAEKEVDDASGSSDGSSRLGSAEGRGLGDYDLGERGSEGLGRSERPHPFGHLDGVAVGDRQGVSPDGDHFFPVIGFLEPTPEQLPLPGDESPSAKLSPLGADMAADLATTSLSLDAMCDGAYELLLQAGGSSQAVVKGEIGPPGTEERGGTRTTNGEHVAALGRSYGADPYGADQYGAAGQISAATPLADERGTNASGIPGGGGSSPLGAPGSPCGDSHSPGALMKKRSLVIQVPRPGAVAGALDGDGGSSHLGSVCSYHDGDSNHGAGWAAPFVGNGGHGYEGTGLHEGGGITVVGVPEQWRRAMGTRRWAAGAHILGQDPSLLKFLDVVWPCAGALFMSIVASTVVYQFFLYIPSQTGNHNLPQILFYLRMISDLVGRQVPWAPSRFNLSIKSPLVLFITALLRITGLPAVFFYIKGKLQFASDAEVIIYILVFWFFSGYINTLAFKLAPCLVVKEYRNRVGALMTVIFQVGSFSGLVIAALLHLALLP